jgi:hypothetical protein
MACPADTQERSPNAPFLYLINYIHQLNVPGKLPISLFFHWQPR